jgi:hypothetical protein
MPHPYFIDSRWMSNAVFSGLSSSLGLVLLGAALPMIIPGSRRMGLLLGLIAVAVMTAPNTISLAESYVRFSSAALRSQLLGRLVLPAPLVFFPMTGVAAILTGITSIYLKNLALRDRIYGVVDEIQGFRFESDAKRPVLVRHPSTGKINVWQAQAAMNYQKRDRAEYLAKFRHSLAELAKEIAGRGLST